MNLYTACLLCLSITFASCNMHKHIVSSGNANRHDITKNYPLFFDAENERVLGNVKKALPLYLEFVKKNRNNATAHYNLARLQLQQMDITQAENNSLQSIKLDPDNRYFRELYTQILLLNKKGKLAEEQYNILIKQHPQDEEYIYEKAMLHAAAKEYDKALSSFTELEKIMGFNEDIIIQKKNIYLKQDNTIAAIQEIEKLKEQDYSSPKYDIIIADIYASKKQSDKVAEIYNQIEKEYPEDPMAQVALAEYYMDKNNTPKYNHYMQMIMKNKNLDVDTKIALLFPALKKLETDTLQRDEIVKMAKTIADESKNSTEALSLYADVLYFARKFDEALLQYKKYITLDKNKFSVWSQIISIYLDRQSLDSVINTSTQCISVFPKNALPYFYAGIAYSQKKNFDSAAYYLQNGVTLEKENKILLSQFYSSLGDVFNSQKKFAASDSCFEQALQIQAADATTLNNYAYYLSLRKERLSDAEKMSKKSLELQPNSKSFLDTYGWILFQQGNYKDALIYIQKAIQADGINDGTLFEHLGDVYYKLGEIEKAKENWHLANEKGESNPTLLKKINDGIFYE